MPNVNALSLGPLGKRRLYFEAPAVGSSRPLREKPARRTALARAFCSEGLVRSLPRGAFLVGSLSGYALQPVHLFRKCHGIWYLKVPEWSDVHQGTWTFTIFEVCH